MFTQVSRLIVLAGGPAGDLAGNGPAEGGLFARQFGDLDLDGGPHFLDPGQHLDPKVTGNLVVAAGLVHQALDRLFQAVLPQARAALVEMLADLRVTRGAELAIQVGVDPVEYLAARSLVGFPAAHDASLPDSAAWGSGPSPFPAGAGRVTPRSAA